jgi:transcriptional regulator with XRE-family HTH domain
MTEPSATIPRGESPGTLLRNARQQQGLELDALAAAIKVRPDKLAALEADHYEQLPDMAFTRAQAKTLCSTLKIDAEPLLAGLPSSLDGGADDVHGVGVGHRLHAHRRVAAEGQHLAAPGHARLQRAAGGGLGHVYGFERRFHRREAHLSSRRATLSRDCDRRSTDWPRKLTDVAEALPMVARKGSAPSRLTVSPACSARDSSS